MNDNQNCNNKKIVLLGQSSIVPDGEWISTKNYPRLYLVRHNNACYLSRQANVGIEPNVSQNWENYWMLVVLDGNGDIDDTLSDISTNPVQNKVITLALQDKQSAINAINDKIPSAASSENQLVDTAKMEAFALPITTKYGANLSLAFNSANGVLTAQLKDQDGNNLGQAQTVEIDLTSIENTINNILALIPAQASAQNQLADKDFVNSSISTNTAHFIGTFNSVAELEAYSGTITNNDYANIIRTEDGQTYYDRYTYNGNTEEWEFNFTVNSTSFTVVQWAAINSGITASKVAEIDQKVDKTTTIAGIALSANISEQQLSNALFTITEIEL